MNHAFNLYLHAGRWFPLCSLKRPTRVTISIGIFLLFAHAKLRFLEGCSSGGEIVSPAFMSQPNLRILSQPRDLLDPDSIVGLRHLVWSGHLVMARPKLNSPGNMNVPHAHFIILSVCLTVIHRSEFTAWLYKVLCVGSFTQSRRDLLVLVGRGVPWKSFLRSLLKSAEHSTVKLNEPC